MVDKLEPPEKWAHLEYHWLDLEGNLTPAGYSTYEDASEIRGRWALADGNIFTARSALRRGYLYHGPCDPNAITLDPAKIDRIATSIVREVCELPDRNSPDDEPEMLLVTCDELHGIVIAEIMKGRGG